MKKLLAFLASLSCVFGLSACEGLPDVLGNLFGDKDSESSEKAPTSVETLEVINQAKQKNDFMALLAENNSFVLEHKVFDGEDTFTRKDAYRYTKENDKLVLDHTQTTGESEDAYYASYIGGMCYVTYADGGMALEISPNNDFTNVMLGLGETLFKGQTLDGEAAVAGDTITLQTMKKISVEGDKQSPYTYKYTYAFEADDMQIVGVDYTIVDKKGTQKGKGDIDFTFNDNTTPNRSAYEAIENATDKKELTVIYNPKTVQEREEVYELSSSVQILMGRDSNDKSYSFYKNRGCTKDIEDMASYWSGQEDVKVYATETKPQVPFVYTLTEEYLTQYAEMVETFEALALVGTDVPNIEIAYEDMMDGFEYIMSQYQVAMVLYYSDMTDDTLVDNYTAAEDAYYDAYNGYIDTLRTMKDSNSPYKDILFEGWTAEDFAQLDVDNETETQLQSEISDIEMQYEQLASQNSNEANELYVQVVEKYQQIAALYGYDNYYDYAALNVYGRKYTKQQREDFRAYVAEYIAPLVESIYGELMTLLNGMPFREQNSWSNFVERDYRGNTDEYLSGYIATFEGSLNKKMNALFNKNAAFFASSENSLDGAHANYIDYYEEGYTYFGVGYQNLLTVVHEMGHYVSFYAYDNSDLPFDLAEVHSQANEWLLLSYLRGALTTRNVFKAVELYRAYSGMWTMLYATIVDEYEEAVYNTENLTADALSGIMAQIAAKYDVNWAGLGYTPFQYAQLVTLTSPVYYLSYATSEAAAMSLYLVEADQGYVAAQEVFRKLQEEVDLSKSFSEMVTGVGLLNPFAEETFVKFVEVFG